MLANAKRSETTALVDSNMLNFIFPGREVAGTVTLKQIYEIAKIKKEDPTCMNVSLRSVCRSVIGSARSMGIEVVPGRDDDR